MSFDIFLHDQHHNQGTKHFHHLKSCLVCLSSQPACRHEGCPQEEVSDLRCLDGQEEELNLLQEPDLNVLDLYKHWKIAGYKRGEKRFLKVLSFMWSFFDCWLPVFTLFSLQAVCLKLCVAGVIFSKLSPLVWLWQVLEAQRRHQKEKFGIIPTSPTPYTYNKVGKRHFSSPFWAASFLWGMWPSGNMANSILAP